MKIYFKLILITTLLFSLNIMQGQDPVTWIPSGNVQVNGNTITKIGGSDWAEGAYSSETISAGLDGYVETTIQETNKRRMFGLSIPPNDSHHYNTIDYAIYIHSAGLYIFENGVNKGGVGSYSAGDVLRVERTGTTIEYYQGTTLLYTSTVSSNTDLMADASFRKNGGTIHNVMIFEDNGGGGCSTTVYADTDGDGFGDSNNTAIDCSNPLPAGWVADNTDCNDNDININPNTVWYQDNDSDNFGNPLVSQTQCSQPVGYVLDNTDCDDTANDPSNNCGGGGGPSVWTQSGDDIRYSDGKVFIGNEALDISSEDYNLFVEKGIITERLKVAIEGSGDWADFVFKKGYKLITIQGLQEFIKENGHLPNMPSAQEVASQGIDVAKMDAMLLQQIEESKLYIIELNEKINELYQKIQQLEQKK